ncbi:armadillo-type protein [Myxozyma melibiosi]|uniref:Armadillo-type protein n=1 Tax=Myxozyma melibiosi TaxID=54550 RepID=A0ABR1F990_9ASCO
MDLVADLLNATQSSEQSIRTSAEQQINELQTSHAPDLTRALIGIGSSPAYAVPLRQSALLVLKHTIARKWSLQFEEFTGEPLTQEVKAQVRAELFQIMRSSERRLQALAANLVSKISSADFPDDWPELFDDLMGLMRSSENECIRGALVILKELLDDGFTFEQFATIAGPVFEALYSLSISDTVSPKPPPLIPSSNNFSLCNQIEIATKAEVIDAVSAALDFFNQVDNATQEMESFVANSIDKWSEVFARNMTIQVASAAEGDLASSLAGGYGVLALKYNTVKAIQRLESTFPSQSQAAVTSRLFPAVWDDLPTSVALYTSVFINSESDDLDLEDPEGVARFIRLIPLEEIESIRSCAQERKEIRQSVKSSPAMVERLMDLATLMSQISADTEEDYKDDPNSFVTEELSLSTKYTCRTAASDLVSEFSDFAVNPIIDALASKLIALASSADGEKRQQQRLLKACLFLLEVTLVQDRSFGKQLFATPAIEQMVQIIYSGISSDDVFLRARSFIFAGTFSRNLKSLAATSPASAEIAEKLYDAALQSASQDSSFIVRACCLLSIQRFSSTIPRSRHKPTQTAIVQGVNSLIADSADDTPSLLVDALEIAIKISPDLAILPETQIVQLLFLSAAKDAANIQLTSDTFEAFELLAELTEPAHYQKFSETAIPPLVQGLGNATGNDEIANSTLIMSLLAILVQHAPSPLPAGLVDYIFPKTAIILMTSDDNQLLQYGSELLAHIIEHDPDQLRDWKDTHGVLQSTIANPTPNGIEVVLSIVARLLNPSLIDESSAMCIGEVVSAVVDKYGRELGSDLLGQLLSATAQRLEAASNPLFIQNLVLVFAHMVTIDAEGVIGFLADLEFSNSSGLETVVRAWLDNFDVFRGYKEIQLNVLALTKLYQLHDLRVEEIVVKGDILVDEASKKGVILTRSRAKNTPVQYSMIPAHAKIVKLLVRELGAIPSDSGIPSRAGIMAAAESNESAVDEGDGDEWEDVFNPADIGLTMNGLSTPVIYLIFYRANSRCLELKKLARSESFGDDASASDPDDDDNTTRTGGGLFNDKGGDESTNELLIKCLRDICATDGREQFKALVTSYCSRSELEILERWQTVLL